jgi:hypothetical protein
LNVSEIVSAVGLVVGVGRISKESKTTDLEIEKISISLSSGLVQPNMFHVIFEPS